MKNLVKVALPLVIGLATQVHGQIVTFDFSSSLNATTVDADLSSSALGSGLGSPAVSSGRAQINSSGWATTADLNTALAGSSYFEFTVTPDLGFQFTPTGFSFDIGNPTIGGISSAALFAVAVNGSATGVSISNSGDIFEGNPAARSATFTGIQNLTSATTFRIYIYDASADASGTIRLDNLSLTGTVSAVPEPAHVAMASALGLVGFGLYRRSRKV
jgi:hypothetical protein